MKRNKQKQIKSILLGLLLLCVSPSIEVKADEATFTAELAKYTGKDSVTADEVYGWSNGIIALRLLDLNDTQIAGVLGNIACESGGNMFAIESHSSSFKSDTGESTKEFVTGNTYSFMNQNKPPLYTNDSGKTMTGRGHGLIQWSFGRATKLTEFTEEHNFAHVTVTHWGKSYDSGWEQCDCKIPDLAGQFAFMCEELTTSYKGVVSNLKKTTTVAAAAKVFHDDYEKSSNSDTSKRAAKGEEAFPLIAACEEVYGSGGSTSQTFSDAMVSTGVWDESTFMEYASLNERNLVLPTAESLDLEEYSGLRQWGVNIESENKIVVFVRESVFVLAILLSIYILFLYLAYWFDRVNNFVEVGVVPMLTFGRLRISPEEHESTFNIFNSSVDRSGVQTVNHKGMLQIVCVCFFFISVILSGVLFEMLMKLVQAISNYIG